MPKKINYASLFTLRPDGRYTTTYTTAEGKRKFLYDSDPKALYDKLEASKANPVMLMSDIADKWLSSHAHEVSYRTIEGYASPLKKINTAFGKSELKDITPAEIQAFVNSLAKKGFKRTAVQRPLNVMRMIFDFAITLSGSTLRSNPCTAVKLPGGLEQENRQLADKNDIDKIHEGLHLPFGLFGFFLLYSGLRKGEALALTDADIHDGIINVNKSVSWQPNQPVIKTPKTKAGNRTVILLGVLAEALPKKWTGYLFSDDGGKTPLTQTAYRHKWEAYCQAAGLADAEISTRTVKTNTTLKHQEGKLIEKTYNNTTWHYRLVPHQLRHEFATLCYDADIPAKDLQDMLGHAKVETTQAIYTHIRESRREQQGKKLDEYVVKMLSDKRNIQ